MILDPEAKAQSKDFQKEICDAFLKDGKDHQIEKLEVQGKRARAARFMREMEKEKEENKRIIKMNDKAKGSSRQSYCYSMEPCVLSYDY